MRLGCCLPFWAAMLCIFGCSSKKEQDLQSIRVSVTTQDGEAITIDVLANFPGLGLSILDVSKPNQGTATIVANKIVYTPPPLFAGTAMFSATLGDGHRQTTVPIEVVSAQALRVRGHVYDVPVRDATVTATVGGASFVAMADGNGAYELAINVGNGAATIAVVAQGTAANNQGQVRLATLLKSFDSLQHSAPVRTLDETTEPNLKISNVSSARYALLIRANGGNTPATDDALATAERAVDPAKLLDIATAIKVNVDRPSFALPAGCGTTLELALNQQCLRTFVDSVGTEPLNEAKAAMFADPQLLPAFIPPATSANYEILSPSVAGFVSRGGTHFFLDTTSHTGFFANRQDAKQLTWSINNGALELDFSDPLVAIRFDSPLNARLPPDILAAFLAQYGQGARLRGTFQTRQIKLRFLLQGIISFVHESDTVHCIYDSFDLPSGRYTPIPFDRIDETDVILRDDSRAPPIPWTDPLVDGAWALQAYYDAGPNIFQPDHRPQFNGDILTFRSADHGGTSLETSRAFTWTISSGDLIVHYNDNSADLYRLIDVAGRLYGVYSQHSDPSGIVASGIYDWSFKRDPAFDLATACWPATGLCNMSTGTNYYWQSYVNAWIPDEYTNSDPAQGLPIANVFGWELHSDLSGARLEGFDDGHGNRGITSYPLTWRIQPQGQLRMESSRQGCTNDPGCHYRLWSPLAATGSRIFVLEEPFQRETASSPYLHFFEPRVTIYQMDAKPRL